jgi:hypothetical protein
MDLYLKDIVFVPSVQHTGTWFTINFLKNFIPKVKELAVLLEDDNTEQLNARRLYTLEYKQALEAPIIVHTHFPIIKYPTVYDADIYGSWFDYTWIPNIEATRRSLPVQTLLLFCNFFKTVIPVRDPMAAILSRESRHPQFRHFFIVDGFVALATEFAKHPNVMFLPIDVAATVEGRMEILQSILTHCSIDSKEHAETLEKIAAEWKPENKTPNNRFKQMYEKQDFRGLKKALGPKWAEVEYLRNMSSIIFPFMSDLGYTREQLRY